MQNDFINHSIDCEDDASWNQNDKDEPKQLITLGQDIRKEAVIEGRILVPYDWKTANDSAK
jgi:hypothetical protein